MKKWSQSLSVINENTDKLNSTEQDAIKTLCNLWRREQFGQKCSDSVERMVSNLLKNENAHGGNQLFLKEALKDFRSISKEFYTKDDETFRQFAAAAKEMLGGPQRTDEQQQRRKENDERRRKEAEQQQQAQQQAEQQRKKREAEQRRQQNNNRQNNNQQNNNRQGSRQQRGQNKLFLWGGLGAAAVVVLVVIGYFVKTSLDNAAAEEDLRRLTAMSLLLKGVWDGELEDRTAQLTIDSVKNDSVFGQVSVKQRRKTDTHAVSGTLQLVDNTLRLSLADQLDADAKTTLLNGSYQLQFNKKEKTLAGKHTSFDNQEQSDLLFTQSDSNIPAKRSSAQASKRSDKQQTAKRKSGEQRSGAVQAAEEVAPQNNGTGFKLEKVESNPSTESNGTGFKLERIKKEDMPF